MSNIVNVQAIMDDIQSTGVAAIFREPFYGHLLSGINKHVDTTLKQKQVTKIKPLGVTTIAFSVHPEKWVKLTKEQKIARFKKEITHYILMHPWAERPSDKGFFYASCDLSANKYAKDTLSLNLFNFGNLSNTYLKRKMNDEGYTDIYSDLKELEKIINSQLTDEEKIKFSIKALSGDFWDPKNPDQLDETMFFLPKTLGGSMDPSAVSQMTKEMKGSGSSKEEIEEAIKDMASEGEDPWKEVGEGTSDLGAKELIKNAFKDAKSRGDVPGELSDYIDIFLSPPKINWRQEVKSFTSTTGNVVAKTTMSKRSKRYKTFPSIKIQRTQRLAIIADSSGSVSDEEFKEFYNEMNGILAENCEIYFLQADANVDQIDHYKGRLPENLTINRHGYGGTAFGPALNFVKTSGRDQDRFDPIDKVDGVIYMTDGYAPAPDHEDYPFCKVLWLTTQKPVEEMVREGFEGNIVFLDVND